MTDLIFYTLFCIYCGIVGFVVGYLSFAPDSHFKQGFIDGMKFKFIWGRK